jgi:ATP-binding cassette subfamily B protein
MIFYAELIKFIWQFMRPQRWIFACVFIFALSWSLDALLWSYVLHLVIDIFSQYEGDKLAAWEALKKPILMGTLGVLTIEAGMRMMGFLLARAIPRLEANIRMAMFDHVQRHSPSYFNDRFAGTLANKISDMTTQVTLIIYQLLWPIIPAIALCILGSLSLWMVNPLFGWIIMGWIAIHIGICLKFTRSCDAYEYRRGEARSNLMGNIVDSLANNFAVNLFYRFDHEKKFIASFQKEEEEKNHSAKQYMEKLRSLLSLFYLIAVILCMNGSLLYLWLHDQISTGQVVQVFNTGRNLAIILWNVSFALPVLFQSLGVLMQAFSVMKEPQDITDPPHTTALIIKKGEIIFENVSFHYDGKKLFTNKDVHIKGGEKIGLVGYSGAGKSTFVNLILRFYPLRKGRILIDGQDTANYTLKSLRRQVALIPQDPLLFHRTLKENIMYGKPEASEEEIIQAAKMAHCDEFIRKCPDGYDSLPGERGAKLSGGERQRIAIARVMLADSPIVILDEATASLDSVSERFIQENLEKIMQNRTTLVIAHRLSTLAKMDRILVFHQGKIIEEGSHQELMAKNGHYAWMWYMQAEGFLSEKMIR